MQNKRCFIIIYPIYALPTYFISNAICIFASFLPNTNVLILVSQVSRRIILKVVGSYNIRCCSPKILCTSVRGKIIIITIILGNLNTKNKFIGEKYSKLAITNVLANVKIIVLYVNEP